MCPGGGVLLGQKGGGPRGFGGVILGQKEGDPRGFGEVILAPRSTPIPPRNTRLILQVVAEHLPSPTLIYNISLVGERRSVSPWPQAPC